MINKDFYNELMMFVESGSIFELSEYTLDISNVKFIDSFKDAEELSTQQESDHCELSWVELRAEKIMGVLNSAREKDQDLYEYVKKDLEQYSIKISRAFYKRKLKGNLNGYAIDAVSEISSDLFDILIDCTVYGKNSNFYKIMFDLYKSGLWPCGWEGDLPNEECLNGYWLVFDKR